MYACRNGHKIPKTRPYGATKGRYWCRACDAMEVSSWFKPIKKTARQTAKKNIKKEIKELD